MALGRSDILYANNFRFGLKPEIGYGTPQFTRDGAGYVLDRDAAYKKRVAQQPRLAYVEINGTKQPVLDLALGDTPILSDSVRFDSASAWSRASLASEAPRNSAIPDLPANGEARHLVGSGAANGFLDQNPTGTPTGGQETGVMVVEDDGSGARVGVIAYDGTIYAQAIWDFSLGGWSEQNGAVSKRTLAERGPNGGEMLLITATGAGPNTSSSRSIWFYFDRGGQAKGAIIHYANYHELGFNPGLAPTVGPPGSTPGEQFYVSPGPYRDDVVQAWYLDYIAGTLVGQGGVDYPITWHGTNSNPRMWLSEDNPTAGQFLFRYFDGSGNNTNVTADLGTVVPGDRVQLAYAVDPTTGKRRLIAKRETDTVVDSGASTPASWSTPSDLGNDNAIAYNETGDLNGTARGRQKFLRHLCALGPSMDNDPLTGGATAVMDELAGVQVMPGGTVISG